MQQKQSGGINNGEPGCQRRNSVDHQIKAQKTGSKGKNKPIPVDPSSSTNHTAVGGNPFLQYKTKDRGTPEDYRTGKLSAAPGLRADQPSNGCLKGPLDKGGIDGKILGCHQ